MTIEPRPISKNPMMRLIWMTLGGLALLAGLIGILLPVVPTTPFIILAAFLFGKGSRTIELWLLNHHTFGPMIADWRKNGAIAPKYKAMGVSMMVCAFGLSLYLRLPATALTAQGICLIGAATYILTRPNGSA